ncbi:hypothetical protein ACJX0J_022694 [Zea mays]
MCDTSKLLNAITFMHNFAIEMKNTHVLHIMSINGIMKKVRSFQPIMVLILHPNRLKGYLTCREGKCRCSKDEYTRWGTCGTQFSFVIKSLLVPFRLLFFCVGICSTSAAASSANFVWNALVTITHTHSVLFYFDKYSRTEILTRFFFICHILCLVFSTLGFAMWRWDEQGGTLTPPIIVLGLGEATILYTFVQLFIFAVRSRFYVTRNEIEYSFCKPFRGLCGDALCREDAVTSIATSLQGTFALTGTTKNTFNEYIHICTRSIHR